MNDFLNSNQNNNFDEEQNLQNSNPEPASAPVPEPIPQPVVEEAPFQPPIQENIPQSPVQEGFAPQNPPVTPPPVNPYFNPQGFNAPVYNPVNITPVRPVEKSKPMSRGLKIFALVLVFVIALTGTSLAGYFIGKSNTTAFGKNHVTVGLENIPQDTDEMTPAKVYEKVNESVVGITVYNTSGAGTQASGIVYSDKGYIITNDHIYAEVPNAKFKIHTSDGTEYDAKYVAGDLISDLAVLKIDSNKLEPAAFGNSDQVYAGQRVVAIGRPDDATDVSSITQGIISATSRRVKNSSNYSARLIQTDSPINPGSSGGALVNMYGQVVGVTSSKLASVQHEGVGYAIPTTVMKRIADELIKNGKVVSRAKLGITYTAINSVTAELNNYSYTGLLLESVSQDSDLYGKLQKGDMIIKINDKKIVDDDSVLDIVEQLSAGDSITVTAVTTKNKTVTYKIKLKANVGESSYTTKESTTEKEEDKDNDASGGTFNFPFGE